MRKPELRFINLPNLLVLLRLLILPLLTICCVACFRTPGTDTGNPATVPAGTNGTNGPVMGSTWQLHSFLCSNIQRCTSDLDFNACNQAVLIDTHVPAAVGLDSTQYPDLTSIYAALGRRILAENLNNETACAQAILSLSCDAILDSNPPIFRSNPDDYSAIYKLLNVSASCQKIYQEVSP